MISKIIVYVSLEKKNAKASNNFISGNKTDAPEKDG